MQAFISHNTESEAPAAQRLAIDLRCLGLATWIAPQSIEIGESFPSAINKGLSQSTHFLLLISPSAMKSPWVQLETDAALQLETEGKIKIVPLVFKECVLPPLLATRQLISFEEAYEHGLLDLGKVMGFEGTQVSELPPPSVPSDKAKPVDPFVEGVLVDLGRSMAVKGYLLGKVEQAPRSMIQAVVEDRSSLRIGISIHPDPDFRRSELLSRMSRELSENYHKLSGLFAIQKSLDTEMFPYQLNESDGTNALHVKWNEMDGREPLGQGIAFFFSELASRK